jgi:tRNA(Arg) A34 adenosine deaminase TadA
MAAVIFKGGKILSMGVNSRRISGLQERYKLNKNLVGIHAEIDAILAVRKKIDLNGAKIAVIRRSRVDSATAPNLGLAKPCEMCQAVLYSYGIRRAAFSVSDSEFGVMRVCDPREHGSGGRMVSGWDE